MATREEHDQYEREWWGNCVNTFAEETKQLTYANRMGLENIGVHGGYAPVYDLRGKSVLDIGGGPVSMLLKCVNKNLCYVADPCSYPFWTHMRYAEAKISFHKKRGEDASKEDYKVDEVWIYNVLQHVDDPQLIINNAKSIAKTIRIFEWIDIPAYLGHPHELKEHLLNEWLQGNGTTEFMHENGCEGKSYYGVFSVNR